MSNPVQEKNILRSKTVEPLKGGSKFGVGLITHKDNVRARDGDVVLCCCCGGGGGASLKEEYLTND